MLQEIGPAAEQEVDWENGKITDEGIEHLRANVGRRAIVPGWNYQVTRDGIWHYALGVGDDNPLWWDDDHAAKSRWGTRIAPPCYLYSHMSGPRLRPQDGKLSVEEYLPGALGLWASELWRWNRPAKAGENIRAESAIVDFKVHDKGKFGGRSVSHVENTQYITEGDNELVAQCDRTIKRFERAATRDKSPYLDRELAVWTAADRERFKQQYLAEAAQRRGERPRYFEDTVVGESLGPILKGPLTVANIIGFQMGWGGPLNATNRMMAELHLHHPGVPMVHPVSGAEENIEAPHWEVALARAGGFPSGYDFGCQRISWISHLLTDWMGDDAFLFEMDTRLLKPNFLNDISWVKGEVVAVEHEPEPHVVVVCSVMNQLEEVTASARARIKLPSKA
jgi:acyl dehydratase